MTINRIKIIVILALVSSSLVGCGQQGKESTQTKEVEQQEKSEKMGLIVGDKIPEILGMDQNGNEIKASDYAGKKLVIYFYPKDNTPGCTAQACNLRDNQDELTEAGYSVLGVSVDNEVSHQKFAEKFSLPFPLIADTDKRLVQEFGVWGEKSMAGKSYMGISRTTFIIDEQGVIARIITPKEISTKAHAEQILNKQ